MDLQDLGRDAVTLFECVCIVFLLCVVAVLALLAIPDKRQPRSLEIESDED